MTEKEAQNKIIKWLKGHGYFVRKWHQGPFAGAGMPDIYALKDGHPVHIEVKRPGNKPTVLQRRMIEELRKHGATAFWADNIKTVKERIGK